MTFEDQDRLAAEHVLGLLEGEEREKADLLLASDVAFRASVETWRKRFAEWDDTAAAQPAGDDLWRRIEAKLPAQKQAVPLRAAPQAQPRARRNLWDSLTFWRTFGLAGAFAALLMTVGMAFFAYKASRQPMLIAVLMNDANQPGAVLRTFADGRAELTPLGDMEVPHNHSIQVWTFPDPASAPVSVGIFHSARTVLLENLPKLQSDQVFALSVEPLTGSPTGQPTGPVVMKGKATTAL